MFHLFVDEVYNKPRPSPNPNVLLELGYALAILGEGRIIGVMNTGNNHKPDELPFDLRHRRWPITYSLSPKSKLLSSVGKHFSIIKIMDIKYADNKVTIREQLVSDLENAIKAALNEPKLGAIRSDVDLHAAQNLWKLISSQWLLHWHGWRTTHPQYEDREYLGIFSSYCRLAGQPENKFKDQTLAKLHNNFILAMANYSSATAVEMLPSNSRGHYVISTKASGAYNDNYDANYKRQVQVVLDGADQVWTTWQAYISELRSRYPEVTEVKTI